MLVAFLAQLPLGTTILLRSPALSSPAPFERMVWECCKELWLKPEWVMPNLELGKSANWYRDVDMVGRCDVVLTFFAQEVMDGGTEHIVEKALDQRIPVYSYGLRDGQLIRIGENDPDDSWGRLAPKIGV